VLLQLVLLLHTVGLRNVWKCSAPDCARLFIKTYRRAFCSPRCQKRAYMRTTWQAAREQEEKMRTRRQRQRAAGGKPIGTRRKG
jgi:hypothetical protein